MYPKVGSRLRKHNIETAIREGKREDGRGFLEYRKIEVKSEKNTNAEGEAWVRIGKTQVLVGVKGDIGEPFPDTPNQGVIITNVELVPVASPTFEPGPPDENAIEIARVVDRGIRSTQAVNLEKLVIKEGEKVWLLFIDVHVLDYDGNLFDATALASIIALKRAEMPKVELDEQGEIRVIEGETWKLPVERIPLSTTIVKIGGKLLVDPTLEEEEAADAMITVTTDGERICSIQKMRGKFTVDEIRESIKIAFKMWNYLSKYVW